MKKLLLVVSLFNLFINIKAQSNKAELYQFLAAPHVGELENLDIINNIYNMYRDSLNSRCTKNKIIFREENDIQGLVSAILNENLVKNKSIIHIGFVSPSYDYKRTKNITLDIFVFQNSLTDIISIKSITISNNIKNTEYAKICKGLINLDDKTYKQDIKRNSLPYYILPYIADYIRFSKPVKLPQLSPLDDKKLINPKQFKEHVVRILGISPSKSFYIENLVKAGRDRSVFTGNDKYEEVRVWFKKYPYLWEFTKVLYLYSVCATDQQTGNNREEHLASLNSETITLGLYLEENSPSDDEIKYWNNTLKMDLFVHHRILMNLSNNLLNCDKFLNSIKVAEKDGNYDEALSRIFNNLNEVVKCSNDNSNYSNMITRLLMERDRKFAEEMERSQKLDKEGKFAESLKALSNAQAINPQDPNPITDAQKIQAKQIFTSPKDSLDNQVLFYQKIIGKIVDQNISLAYHGDIVQRKGIVTKDGQSIFIQFDANINSKSSDLSMSIGFYPKGQISYPKEYIEDDIIANTIKSVYGLFQDSVTRPSFEIYITGSADITSYSGFVLPNYNEKMSADVKLCKSMNSDGYQLRELRKRNASNRDKNMALAYLRADNKARNIVDERCKDIMHSTKKCVVLSEVKGTEHRFVGIVLRITFGK